MVTPLLASLRWSGGAARAEVPRGLAGPAPPSVTLQDYAPDSGMARCPSRPRRRVSKSLLTIHRPPMLHRCMKTALIVAVAITIAGCARTPTPMSPAELQANYASAAARLCNAAGDPAPCAESFVAIWTSSRQGKPVPDDFIESRVSALTACSAVGWPPASNDLLRCAQRHEIAAEQASARRRAQWAVVGDVLIAMGQGFSNAGGAYQPLQPSFVPAASPRQCFRASGAPILGQQGQIGQGVPVICN